MIWVTVAAASTRLRGRGAQSTRAGAYPRDSRSNPPPRPPWSTATLDGRPQDRPPHAAVERRRGPGWVMRGEAASDASAARASVSRRGFFGRSTLPAQLPKLAPRSFDSLPKGTAGKTVTGMNVPRLSRGGQRRCSGGQGTPGGDGDPWAPALSLGREARPSPAARRGRLASPRTPARGATNRPCPCWRTRPHRAPPR